MRGQRGRAWSSASQALGKGAEGGGPIIIIVDVPCLPAAQKTRGAVVVYGTISERSGELEGLCPTVGLSVCVGLSGMTAAR